MFLEACAAIGVVTSQLKCMELVEKGSVVLSSVDVQHVALADAVSGSLSNYAQHALLVSALA